MEAYFQKIESLVTILASLDSPVSDEDVVHYVLDGLPKKYNQVCGYMHYKDTFPNLKTTRSLLIAEVNEAQVQVPYITRGLLPISLYGAFGRIRYIPSPL
ncbi:hypothetical protein Tco_0043763 [Tanacetum coccineum]